MRIAFAIYDDGNYAPGTERLVKALKPYGYPVIVRNPLETEVPRGNTGKWWLEVSFAWFEVLTWDKYDRVIVIDSDMLIIGDISYLLTEAINKPWGMTTASATRWQCGLVVVNRHLMKDPHKVYADLIAKMPERKWEFGDQSLLNDYISDDDVQSLPREYNWLKKNGNALPYTKILHFHGRPKPWEEDYDYSHKYWRYWE